MAPAVGRGSRGHCSMVARPREGRGPGWLDIARLAPRSQLRTALVFAVACGHLAPQGTEHGVLRVGRWCVRWRWCVLVDPNKEREADESAETEDAVVINDAGRARVDPGSV